MKDRLVKKWKGLIKWLESGELKMEDERVWIKLIAKACELSETGMEVIDVNPRYKEILRLDKILSEEKIPHTLVRFEDGYQIALFRNNVCIGDVVQHKYSYGAKNDLLESMGFGECDVKGCLTAEQAAELFRER